MHLDIRRTYPAPLKVFARFEILNVYDTYCQCKTYCLLNFQVIKTKKMKCSRYSKIKDRMVRQHKEQIRW